jgi:4-diphosphocytidyl-2-C-methyl-D-erythritol kinase
MTEQLIDALRRADSNAAARFLHNDFETTVFARYPQLAAIKQLLLRAGCVAAVMSGSGSTIVGIARSADHAREIKQTIGRGADIADVLVCRTLDLDK